MSDGGPIIRDNVGDFSDKDKDYKDCESGEPSNQSKFTTSSYFETINSQILEDQQFSNP